jgi:hypothetical protein
MCVHNKIQFYIAVNWTIDIFKQVYLDHAAGSRHSQRERSQINILCYTYYSINTTRDGKVFKPLVHMHLSLGLEFSMV